jgi:hypothetical protein
MPPAPWSLRLGEPLGTLCSIQPAPFLRASLSRVDRRRKAGSFTCTRVTASLRVRLCAVADDPRLLARHSPRGYVDHPSRALRSGGEVEPEAVDEETQRRFSDEARQRYEIARAEEIARKQCRSRRGRLQKVTQDARRKHIDISKQLIHIEKEIAIAEQLVHPAT